MKRRSKFLIFLPTGLLLVLALAMAWLLRTQSGAEFAWRQASSLVDAELSVGRISGNLSSGLVLDDFLYQDGSVRVSSPQIRLSVNLDLLSPAINLAQLDSTGIEIQLMETDSPPEAPLAEALAGLQLPFPVRFGAVSVDRLQVLDAGQSTLFNASDIAARARWHDRLEVASARLNTTDTEWQLDGELGLRPPFELHGTISARSELQLADGSTIPADLQASFHGDLDRLETEVLSVQPGFVLEGELRDLLTLPGWKLEGFAEKLSWPPGAQSNRDSQGAGSLLAAHQLSLSSQGNLHAYDVQLAAQLTGEDVPHGTLELSGRGDAVQLRLEHVRFTGDELELSATGVVDFDSQALAADTRIENLQPQRWVPDWPAGHPLRGQLQLQSSFDQLAVNDLSMQIVGTETRIDGSGVYPAAGGPMTANLRWQSLAWPLGVDSPDWTSNSGQLQLEGVPEDWRAKGELQLLAGDLPEGSLQLSARGGNEGMKLEIPGGRILGGTFSGWLDYQWNEPQRWSADITAERISTSPLAPDFPGVLSGRVLAEGAVNEPELRFELQKVQGRIRSLDVTAAGRLSLSDGVLEADGLQLRSGSAQLRLDGGMGPGKSLEFAAQAADLSQLWPDLAGRLQASGELSLDAKQPRLDIDLNADELDWGEYHFNRIRTQNNPDGSTAIMLTDAMLGDRELRELELILDNSHRLQSVDIRASLDDTEIESALRGQLQSADGRLINGWNGQLERLRLSQPERGFLELEQPASLVLAIQRMELDSACLRGSRDGRVCLQASWSDQGDAGLSAGLEEISLDIVRLFVDMDWAFTHRLSGKLDWSRPAGQQASAQAQLELSSGDLLFEEEVTHFSTGPGILEFQLSQGNLHSGRLHIPIIDSGEINMDFSISQVLDDEAAELQANLKLQLRDLTPLQLLPYVDVAQGELSADLRISGSPADPQFTGHAVLVRGRLENQAAGLVLSEIQLAGAVYRYDHTELNGSFRAGDGRGRIKADLRFGDFLHPEFSMQVSGEDLLLVDVPDMKLLADPDLGIRWANSRLQLNGKVRVPEAKLSPRYLPATTASESPDLVIVSGGDEAPATAVNETGPLRITGQVEVELGPEVNITLDRATASIKGKSRFTWNDSLVPIGDGAYTVSGEIYAYGQLLSISEGRVSFPNVPADNPYLSIKAEREIFGNTQIKRAGVLVSGTLKRPSLDPYTDPMSNRERALALLLTGSDFDYEQGVGAVEVGMYIAPKLYVSYGIGLFEDQNVISARYDLGKGFGVKATSGQRETGVDISYTVEQ